jgi:hypothetical protein
LERLRNTKNIESIAVVMLGALMIISVALAGSIVLDKGRALDEKLDFLRSKKVPLTTVRSWENNDDWAEEYASDFGREYNTEKLEMKSWEEFWGVLKILRKVPDSEGGLLGEVKYDAKALVIWFETLKLIGTKGRGEFKTYWIQL